MSKFDAILQEPEFVCLECVRHRQKIADLRVRVAQLQEIVRSELRQATEEEIEAIVATLPRMLRHEARAALLKANAPQ